MTSISVLFFHNKVIIIKAVNIKVIAACVYACVTRVAKSEVLQLLFFEKRSFINHDDGNDHQNVP